MAQVIWTEPALQDLDQIADYISLDNPKAAKKLVRRCFKKWKLLPGIQKRAKPFPNCSNLYIDS